MKVYYKMRQILLQHATVFLLQNATEIYQKNRQFYNKIRQLLQNVTILLQNATVITKCDKTVQISMVQLLKAIIYKNI